MHERKQSIEVQIIFFLNRTDFFFQITYFQL